MLSPSLLVIGGVVIGLVIAYAYNQIKNRNKTILDLPDPAINSVQCLSATRIRINGSIDPAPPGATLLALYVVVYNDDTHSVPSSPHGEGATDCGTSFPLEYDLPTGLTGPMDLVAVWAEYEAHTKDKLRYRTCTGSGSGGTSSSGMRVRERGRAARAGEFEAIPKAYRVSPASPPAGTAGGPAADLVGTLNGGLLEHAPEDSTPTEPVWRAGGGAGAGVRWTLRLLHRRNGMGAVLTAVYTASGREVRLTWVTSDWRLHAASRLTSEADEPGVPALLVRPA